MSAVTTTRTVVILGRGPRVTTDVLGDVRPGEEAAVFVLGLEPTAAQRRLTETALAMAAERRFVLTAELIPTPSLLEERLRDGDRIQVLAARREARRWRIPLRPQAR
jgi:hypothetical protein